MKDVRVLAVLRHGFSVIDQPMTEAEFSELLTIAMDTDNPDYHYEQDFLQAVRLPEFSHMSPPRFASVIAGIARQCPKGSNSGTLSAIRKFTIDLLSREKKDDPGRFKIAVALLVMGVDPMHAKAADVRNARELVEMNEPAWAAWHADLSQISGRETIKLCRDPVISQWILHQRASQGTGRTGEKLKKKTLTITFARARDKSGLTWSSGTPPSFHEQRSLSERLYREQGIDTRSLLGHKSQSMTDRYNDDRGKEWKVVSL